MGRGSGCHRFAQWRQRRSYLNLDDLDGFLTERLARYKHPKALEIVDALPRNPSGKVLKTELRERFGSPINAR